MLNKVELNKINKQIRFDIIAMSDILVYSKEVEILRHSEEMVEAYSYELPKAPKWVDVKIKNHEFHLEFNEEYTDEEPTSYKLDEVIKYLSK